MSVHQPLYITHDEIPWTEIEARGGHKDRVAQLCVGSHVLLEVAFHSSSDTYDDEEAANVMAEKLKEILK